MEKALHASFLRATTGAIIVANRENDESIEARMLAMFNAESTARQVVALQQRLDKMSRDMEEQEKEFAHKIATQEREFDESNADLKVRLNRVEGYFTAGKTGIALFIVPVVGFIVTVIWSWLKHEIANK